MLRCWRRLWSRIVVVRSFRSPTSTGAILEAHSMGTESLPCSVLPKLLVLGSTFSITSSRRWIVGNLVRSICARRLRMFRGLSVRELVMGSVRDLEMDRILLDLSIVARKVHNGT